MKTKKSKSENMSENKEEKEETTQVVEPKEHEISDSVVLNSVQFESCQNHTDWRSIIGSSHVYPNKSYFDFRNLPVPETTEGLPDKALCISLGGFRKLALEIGYKSVSYTICNLDEHFACVKCSILWNNGQTFESIATCHSSEQQPPFDLYLASIAENRSFARAVRFYMNINVVCEEELSKVRPIRQNEDGRFSGGKHVVREMPSAQNVLEATCQSCFGFKNAEDLKSWLRTNWAVIKPVVSFTASDIKTWKDSGFIRDAGISNVFCQELVGAILNKN